MARRTHPNIAALAPAALPPAVHPDPGRAGSFADEQSCKAEAAIVGVGNPLMGARSPYCK